MKNPGIRLYDCVDRHNIEDFPLTRYSAQYWATHASLQMRRHASSFKDENVFLAQTGYFRIVGFGFTTKEGTSRRSMSTMHLKKPEAIPPLS